MNDYSKYMDGMLVEEKWRLYIDTAGFSKVQPHQSHPQKTMSIRQPLRSLGTGDVFCTDIN